jgi:hypothetical protein
MRVRCLASSFVIPDNAEATGALLATSDGMLWVQVVQANQTGGLMGFSSANP